MLLSENGKEDSAKDLVVISSDNVGLLGEVPEGLDMRVVTEAVNRRVDLSGDANAGLEVLGKRVFEMAVSRWECLEPAPDGRARDADERTVNEYVAELKRERLLKEQELRGHVLKHIGRMGIEGDVLRVDVDRTRRDGEALGRLILSRNIPCKEFQPELTGSLSLPEESIDLDVIKSMIALRVAVVLNTEKGLDALVNPLLDHVKSSLKVPRRIQIRDNKEVQVSFDVKADYAQRCVTVTGFTCDEKGYLVDRGCEWGRRIIEEYSLEEAVLSILRELDIRATVGSDTAIPKSVFIRWLPVIK